MSARISMKTVEIYLLIAHGIWLYSPWPRRTPHISPIRLEAITSSRERRLRGIGWLIWDSDLQQYQWHREGQYSRGGIPRAVEQICALLHGQPSPQLRRRRKGPQPWLPPTPEPELTRQLDLFLWGNAYQSSRARWQQQYDRAFDRLLMQLPQMHDFPSLARYFEAKDRWEHQLDVLKHKREHGDPEEIAAIVLRGAIYSWETTRQLIYERDGGICQVCGDAIPYEHYECGHIIDRVVGGSDRLCNLVCMCITCNRLKPCTETRDAYVLWAKKGGPIVEMTTMLLDRMNTMLGDPALQAAYDEDNRQWCAHEALLAKIPKPAEPV
jgi:5-methylcytosine-specific restriction endonuclease McrA